MVLGQNHSYKVSDAVLELSSATFFDAPHCLLLEDGRIQADSSLISFFDQGKVLWFIASLCGIEYILVTIFQMHLSFVCF